MGTNSRDRWARSSSPSSRGRTTSWTRPFGRPSPSKTSRTTHTTRTTTPITGPSSRGSYNTRPTRAVAVAALGTSPRCPTRARGSRIKRNNNNGCLTRYSRGSMASSRGRTRSRLCRHSKEEEPYPLPRCRCLRRRLRLPWGPEFLWAPLGCLGARSLLRTGMSSSRASTTCESFSGRGSHGL